MAQSRLQLSIPTPTQDDSPMQSLQLKEPEPIHAPDLPECLDIYLRAKQARVSAETLSGYRRHFAPFLRWWEENAASYDHALSPPLFEHFQHWLVADARTRAGEPYSPQTVYTCAVRVRQFLNWLRDNSNVTVDIAQWMPLPPQPTIDRRFLEVGELQALFDGLAKFRPFSVSRFRFRDAAMLALLVDTGMRRLELAHAQRAEVQWHARCLNCQALIIGKPAGRCCERPDLFADRSGHIRLKRVKRNFRGEEKWREVVFGPETGQALRLHLDTLMFADLASAQEDTIFGMSDTAIRGRIERLSAATNIYCHAHAFRYTMSDYWQRKSVDAAQGTLWLKVQLGHALPRDITFLHYTDLQSPRARVEGLVAHRHTPMDAIKLPDLWS